MKMNNRRFIKPLTLFAAAALIAQSMSANIAPIYAADGMQTFSIPVTFSTGTQTDAISDEEETKAKNPSEYEKVETQESDDNDEANINDEKEQGERALLNLGHTFGHAIESYLGYGEWLHGEAVATGMVMAADLSCKMGWISQNDLERTRKIIARAKLPIVCPQIPLDDFLGYMAHDKKVLNGQLRLILMKNIGQAVITKEFDIDLMKQAILENQQS